MGNVTKSEIVILVLLAAFLMFAGVNFDDKIQNLFGFIVLFIAIIRILDINQKTSFPIERVRNLKRTFTLTVIGLVATYLGTMLVFGIDNYFGGKLFGIQNVSLNTVFSLFAQQPFVFSGNIILTFLAIGFVVAISETWLLITLMDFIADKFNIDFDLMKARTYAIILLLVGGIVTLHFNVKGFTAAALVPVAVFFFVSLIIAIKERQGLAAIFMHVINNTIALTISYGVISSLTITGPLLIGITVMVGIYLLFKTKILVRPLGG
mgnify:CR=1 FL=1